MRVSLCVECGKKLVTLYAEKKQSFLSLLFTQTCAAYNIRVGKCIIHHTYADDHTRGVCAFNIHISYPSAIHFHQISSVSEV